MCSFPKCITYISQVYSPSVNVRKPWKYVNLAEVHELLFGNIPLNFTDLVQNAPNTEHNEIGAQ